MGPPTERANVTEMGHVNRLSVKKATRYTQGTQTFRSLAGISLNAKKIIILNILFIKPFEKTFSLIFLTRSSSAIIPSGKRWSNFPDKRDSKGVPLEGPSRHVSKPPVYLRLSTN